MSDQFWLNQEKLARIKPYFPLSHGVMGVDIGIRPKSAIAIPKNHSFLICVAGARPSFLIFSIYDAAIFSNV